MAVKINRGTSDDVMDQIIGALESYAASHPRAAIDVYRQDRFSVRVRIIDPDFAQMSRPQRHDLVWRTLDMLADDVQSDISMLVLVAPDELAMSGSNMEFEDPVPSVLL
jgi:stress-induced morphogen